MAEGSEIVRALSRRYPQLLLPIARGMSQTEQYRRAVLRGVLPDADPVIAGSASDSFETVRTEFGSVGIWYLAHREDFVRAVQALAHRCEPVALPASVGAQYIGGLVNWETIRAHRAQYLAAGGGDWSRELRRFAADRSCCTDCLILLGSGFYSDVPAQEASLPERTWREASLRIRKYHELTHFVYRRAYPGDVDAVRDEVLADCVGLLAAFGRYDSRLARRVLGICGGGVLPGGRLRHYVPEEALPAAVHRACFWIDALSRTASLVPIRPGEAFEPFFLSEAGKNEFTLPE